MALMPFTSLEGIKARPALVLSVPDACNVTLAVITSKKHYDHYGVEVPKNSFYYDPLIVCKPYSEIRSSQLFTISREVIDRKIGVVSNCILMAVKMKIKQMLDL